ncbi:alpha/beta fold hydrolase [Succinimonas sp.]|uniref:alpha/beta fold hydrolase n=1 Tax=Succinimonas sp. TaxID=1936151 RepID=UPI00386EE011
MTGFSEECGPAAAVKVFFLAGFMGVPGEFARVRELISEDSREILPEDLLPSPEETRELLQRRDLPPDYFFREARARLRKIITASGAERVCLYGYSLGGRLALSALFMSPEYKAECAAEYEWENKAENETKTPENGLKNSPEYPGDLRRDWPMISGLILESSGLGIRDPEERRRRLLHDENLARRFAAEFSPELLREWYTQPVFAGLSSRVRESLIQKRRHIKGEEAARVLSCLSSGRMPWLLPALEASRELPVLLLTGERDPKYQALLKSVTGPDIALLTVPHAGHNIHDEVPEETARIIEDFLRNRCQVPGRESLRTPEI